MPDAPAPPRWTPAASLDELAPGSLTARKLAGRQLVVARTEDGEVFALDNRCPHEGYPLATGTLRGCDLTCCWHNWKFDVRDGACRVGGEAVRAFPTRVVDGAVEVDLAEPDPRESFEAWLESLRVGLSKHQNDRAIRDVVRLLDGGYDPWRILGEVARHDALHAEWGTTHVLAVAADCGRLLERYPGSRAAYALAPVVDLCGETNRCRPPRERAAPLPGADEAGLRAAVEEEDAARAEGLLLGAFDAGVPRATLEGWLYAVVSDHFLDFGHQLIYLVKARELVDRAGEEYARDLYASLLFRIVYGTREDTLPYMRYHAEHWAQVLEEERAVWFAAESSDAVLDGDAFRAAVLDGPDAGTAMGALVAALRAGVPASRLARELVVAAAERVLRFDLGLDARGDVAENWLWVTHRFTFAAAVRGAVERWDHPDRVSLLAQAVMFLHSGRAMDLPPEARAGREPERVDVRDVLAPGDPERTVRRALGSLPDDAAARALRELVEDLVLGDPVVRPIVLAHAIKMPCAAFEEREALAGHPLRDWPVAAALRFLTAPIRERRVHDLVTTSIEWVVDGKIPRKLTQ